MRYVIFATPTRFSISLTPPADSNSVSWLVRDNAGLLITAASGTLANDQNATVVSVPTSAITNTRVLPTTSVTENRFLQVNWVSGGVDQSTMFPYVLIDFMPVRITAADVISLLGTNLAELVSTDIDIMSAIELVREDLTSTVFTTALTAGNMDTLRVNQMVSLRAAIELAPSLQLRVAQMQKSDTSAFTRFKGFDVVAFTADLWVRYARLRGDLSTAPGVVVQPSVVTASPSDTDLFAYPTWFPIT